MLCANCHRLTHDARASRVADDPNAPLSVPHAHAEHQREVRLVQHHLMRARCAHGIGGSGACNITTDMNDDGRCPPPSLPRCGATCEPSQSGCGGSLNAASGGSSAISSHIRLSRLRTCSFRMPPTKSERTWSASSFVSARRGRLRAVGLLGVIGESDWLLISAAARTHVFDDRLDMAHGIHGAILAHSLLRLGREGLELLNCVPDFSELSLSTAAFSELSLSTAAFSELSLSIAARSAGESMSRLRRRLEPV